MVSDNTDPVFNDPCPADVNVESTNLMCDYDYSFIVPDISDNCSLQSIDIEFTAGIPAAVARPGERQHRSAEFGHLVGPDGQAGCRCDARSNMGRSWRAAVALSRHGRPT